VAAFGTPTTSRARKPQTNFELLQQSRTRERQLARARDVARSTDSTQHDSVPPSTDSPSTARVSRKRTSSAATTLDTQPKRVKRTAIAPAVPEDVGSAATTITIDRAQRVEAGTLNEDGEFDLDAEQHDEGVGADGDDGDDEEVHLGDGLRLPARLYDQLYDYQVRHYLPDRYMRPLRADLAVRGSKSVSNGCGSFARKESEVSLAMKWALARRSK
jgi:hypothetical protein